MKIFIAFACNANCNYHSSFFSIFPSRRCFVFFLNGLPKVFLGTFYHSLSRKRLTKIGLILLDTLKEVDMPCALEKIIIASKRVYTVTDIPHLR